MYDSQAKSIGDLLSNNQRARIIVPRFQRGYSWERRHVTAFWRDIRKFKIDTAKRDGPEKYFLGPIVIREDSKEAIYLLDGQQRLATTTILLSTIRNFARALKTQASADFARDIQREMIEKTDGVFALELGELDGLYFEQTIQKDPPEPPNAKLRSHRAIDSARRLLEESLRTETASLDPTSSLKYLKELSQVLRSDLIMASIPVKSERDAFQIFETLNDRGLRLSVPDLLLNYLMGAASNDEERKQIRGFWNEMITEMGQRDMNRFLRHLWISRFGDLKSQDLFSALKSKIESSSISAVDFASSCADECESYVALLDAAEDSFKETARPLKALVRQLNFQAALPLLLSTYKFLPLQDFDKLIRLLLVFVTRYSVVSKLDPSGAETVMFELAMQARQQLVDADAKKKSTAGADAFVLESSDVKDTLTFLKTELRKEAPTDDAVRLAGEELLLENDEAKYLLARLASFLQTNTKEVTIDEANLEHIFPQRAKEVDWGGKDKLQELEPYIWHLGNLTILGTRLNRTAGNKAYAVKRQHYEQKSELKMAQDVAALYQSWGINEIRDRAKSHLAPKLPSVWDFDNTSRA